MLNKRGEITTQQIVIFIVLIASFAVLLFFIFKINFGDESDKEICHNSVVMREKSILADNVPLKCNRQYVCLSVDSSCEKMTNPQIKKVESQEEVYQVLADELADCWWMFGEGKINYIGDDIFTTDHYCSICSQIAFDDSVKDLFWAGISQEEFLEYLDRTEFREGKSYHQYLYEYGFRDVDFKGEGEFKEYSLDKQYYSIMGVKSDISDWTKYSFGAVAVIGAIVASPILGPSLLLVGTSIFVVGAGGAAYYTAPVIAGDSGQEFTRPSLVEANSLEFQALNCYSIETLS